MATFKSTVLYILVDAVLDAVPRDVWQLIFFFLASECSPRPPSAIIPLILTNRRMHGLFCGCKSENAHLYGDMFVNYCDIRAPRRRLGFNFTTSSCCSRELRDRLACIKRRATTRMLNCSSAMLALQALSWIRRGPTYLRRSLNFHTLFPTCPFYFGWCGWFQHTVRLSCLLS
ncbi:hypothetical protein JB92DRAFT_951134 [Gautieria morchelliformis]|nr:hypothetical protein JB92DRAFT_951134 [Gautieria morchelliformis]